MINRINYKNQEKESDFEIVDIQEFFRTRPKRLLEMDYRLNFWSIIYISSGTGSHYVDFKKYNYCSGDIILIRKDQVHHFIINSHVKGFVLHINEPLFYRLSSITEQFFWDLTDRFNSPILSWGSDESSTPSILVELLFREYSRDDSRFSAQLIVAIFESFILSLREKFTQNGEIGKSRDHKHFKAFRDLVELHYRDIKKVEEYAIMMGLTTKTLNLATRMVVDLSAKQFINQRVSLEIKRSLTMGELLNYEIAELLGFDDPGNMTKFFMRSEGISIKEFRARVSSS